MKALVDFDVQASPKCLEIFGWRRLRDIADDYVNNTPDLEFYPERWFFEGRSEAPEKVKLAFLALPGMTESQWVEVLAYTDRENVRVISFDPARKIPLDFKITAKDGPHRVRPQA